MQRPTILNGLLFGALIASLSWNVHHVMASDGAALPASEPSLVLDCCPEVSQQLAASEDLTQDQIDQIAQQCGESCQRSIELDQQAATKLEGVWDAVADPSVSWEEVHNLLEETIALRAESLRESVHTALDVRETLPNDWVQSLFKQCHEKCLSLHGLGKKQEDAQN